jgi:hypothetical protein
MLDRVKGVDSGGGFPSDRKGLSSSRTPGGLQGAQDKGQDARDPDRARLSAGGQEAVRSLAGLLEALQLDLAALPETAGGRRDLVRRLAEARVTMANLLGVGAEAPAEAAAKDLARVLTQLGKAGDLPRERVLGLLCEGESPEERKTP